LVEGAVEPPIRQQPDTASTRHPLDVMDALRIDEVHLRRDRLRQIRERPRCAGGKCVGTAAQREPAVR
jgi:hypothetical protein